MGRQSTLRTKAGYWCTYVWGKTTRFGRVDEVPESEALRRFQEFLTGVEPEPEPEPELSVSKLATRFLEWVREHRGEKAYIERGRHPRRFQALFGKLPATAISATHLEKFLASLRRAGHAPDCVHKHLISVKAMFNRGARKGWIPPAARFASLEPVRRPLKALIEADLLTNAEIEVHLRAADADRHPQMGDLIRFYHATGARTHELFRARVSDVQKTTRQIVLGRHKREHTMKDPVPRAIPLSDAAFAIVGRRCEGRAPQDYLFTKPRGNPWTLNTLSHRFQKIRDRAAVRSSVTFYSFRHLWISDMLMAGVDLLLVARMAGTSVTMIERVYGHFRNQSYQDALARIDRLRGL
jgi:integrase